MAEGSEPGRPAPGGGGTPGTGREAGDGGTLLGRRADPRTNTIVKWVLRTGLVLSFVVLVVGLVVELATGTHEAVAVRMFDLFAPRPVGERIMAVGVLLLTVTPACGVLSVLLSWIRERDRRYVGVGIVVVAVLGAAVAVGFG